MRAPVYISIHLDSIKKDLIIEEDKHSIWAYLLDSENDNIIVLDGFICSRGTVLEKSSDVKEYIENNFAPPISEEFANRYTIQKDLVELDFKIELVDDKVTILIKDDRFLVLDIVNFNSYSKSVAKAGPYGLPMESLL